jgi:uncharacterized protein
MSDGPIIPGGMRLPDAESPVRTGTLKLRFQDDPTLSEIVARCKLTALWGENASIGQAGMVKLEGELCFERTVPCARCLKEVKRPVKSRFETIFNLDEGTAEAADLETPPEPGGFERIGQTGIDATLEIRQRVYLACEEIVYCRSDCKGLCSRCGADLNQGECGCDRGTDGGAFDGLRGLLDKL